MSQLAEIFEVKRTERTERDDRGDSPWPTATRVGEREDLFF
jgi:hypothetical protein